jgi:hypothetical protein
MSQIVDREGIGRETGRLMSSSEVNRPSGESFVI